MRLRTSTPLILARLFVLPLSVSFLPAIETARYIRPCP
jgi:hypothetical protein